MNINIAKDYTETPGGRFIVDGKFSGEDFRESILYAKIKSIIDSDEIINIDLDGGYGYGSSFLEEAFGGLIRKLKKEKYSKDELVNLKNRIIIKSDEEPILEGQIKEYIERAISEKE